MSYIGNLRVWRSCPLRTALLKRVLRANLLDQYLRNLRLVLGHHLETLEKPHLLIEGVQAQLQSLLCEGKAACLDSETKPSVMAFAVSPTQMDERLALIDSHLDGVQRQIIEADSTLPQQPVPAQTH